MAQDPTEALVGSALSRRARVYAELGRGTTRTDWASPSWVQSMAPSLSHTWGENSLSHVAVCRLGDMREAAAIVSGDGPLATPHVVSVRVQMASEGFGPSHLVMQSGEVIQGVQLVSLYNPLYHTGARKALEKSLVCAVSYGSSGEYFRLYISHNYGQSWALLWDVAPFSYIARPRLLTHADKGYLYLFYADRSDGRAIKYLCASSDPATWATSFEWDGVPTSISQTDAATGAWDIYHDTEGWVYFGYSFSGSDMTRTVCRTASQEPTSWTSTVSLPAYAPGAPAAACYAAVARTGGVNAWGNLPQGDIVCVYSDPAVAGALLYTLLDCSQSPPAPVYDAYPLYYESASYAVEGDPEVSWDPDRAVYGSCTSLDDRKWWRGVRTPSTSTIYEEDSDLGHCLRIDNHGPDTDGESKDQPTDDVAHSFGGFWTASSEESSALFPEFDDTQDFDFYFSLKPSKAEYHNIWFCVEDPAHPDTPIFKMDFYVGEDASGHPHDTARGCRIWFCKRSTVPDYPQLDPTDDSAERYRHPLNHMFDGYAAHGDNLAAYFFKIHYDHEADEFSLLRAATQGGTYSAFIPYADREMEDVGGGEGNADAYVAGTQPYWRQPRGELWPRRVYIGCPETKPALQKQSGLKVGRMWGTRASVTRTRLNTAGSVCLTPRMSGGLDLWHVSATYPDTLRRQTFGHPMRDVWTALSFRSSQGVDAGPDQAELQLLDIDNFERNSIYGAVRNHRMAVYAAAGCDDRTQAGAGSGVWGRWAPLFYGTVDTGGRVTADDGPTITASAYNPLRDAGRTYNTVNFAGRKPPPELDATTGEPVEPPAKDQPRERTQQVLYLLDFDHPFDETKPVDKKGRLMHFDDYITRYVWEELLGRLPEGLEIVRVGLTPASFTLNQDGTEKDALTSLQELWKSLGLTWWYSYETAHLVVKKRIEVLGDGRSSTYADVVFPAAAMLAVPVERPETDWGRAGAVALSTTNMEGNPNRAVARNAPWPDGAGMVEEQCDAVSNQASQWGLADMYRKSLPLAALLREWKGARKVTVPIYAFPYLQRGSLVWFTLDNPSLPTQYRAYINEQYGDLARVWLVDSIDTQWSPEDFMQQVTLVDPSPFPV